MSDKEPIEACSCNEEWCQVLRNLTIPSFQFPPSFLPSLSGNFYLESLSPDSLGTITRKQNNSLGTNSTFVIDTCFNFELKLIVSGVRTTETHQHLKSALCNLVSLDHTKRCPDKFSARKGLDQTLAFPDEYYTSTPNNFRKRRYSKNVDRLKPNVATANVFVTSPSR